MLPPSARGLTNLTNFFNTPILLQESVQEKITIEEFFQPFEIQWLLEYIYFPCKSIDRPEIFRHK